MSILISKLGKEVRELFVFVIVVVQNMNLLLDVLVYGKATIIDRAGVTNLDLHCGLRAELACKGLHLIRPGSTKHEGLSVRVLDMT